jgi:hypothetical protein
MEGKIRLAVFGQKRLSREGGIEIVVKELCTRMAKNGCEVTCYNRAGHHVSGAEYDKTIEYDGIRQKVVPTIEKKGLAAVSSSFFAALCSAFGRYDVVHIHAIGPALLVPYAKMLGMKVVFTHHGPDYDRDKWGFTAKSVLKLGERLGCRFADDVIVISEVIQDLIARKYHRRERVHLFTMVCRSLKFATIPNTLKNWVLRKESTSLACVVLCRRKTCIT